MLNFVAIRAMAASTQMERNIKVRILTSGVLSDEVINSCVWSMIVIELTRGPEERD